MCEVPGTHGCSTTGSHSRHKQTVQPSGGILGTLEHSLAAHSWCCRLYSRLSPAGPRRYLPHHLPEKKCVATIEN